MTEQSPAARASPMSKFVEEYGWPFLVVYTVISASVFVAIYAAILWGAHVDKILDSLGLHSKTAETTSVLLLAIMCTKLLVPLKVPVAGAITVLISRRRRKTPRAEYTSLLTDDPDDEERPRDLPYPLSAGADLTDSRL